MASFPIPAWPWTRVRARPRQRRLASGSAVGLRPGPRPRLVVEHGRVWVTQTGEGRDHILAPGEGVNLHPRGRVVVQALAEADLVLTDLVEDGI